MMIRKYGHLPQVFVPDIGEIIQGRRAVTDKFVKAAVTHVRRQTTGYIKLTVIWLEDDPDAGAQGPSPIKAGKRGWIYFVPDRMNQLVRQT